MNYKTEIIKQVDKLKECNEFKDIVKEFEDVLSKNSITQDEYNKKINRFIKEYPVEMNIISTRDTIVTQIGKKGLPLHIKKL